MLKPNLFLATLVLILLLPLHVHAGGPQGSPRVDAKFDEVLLDREAGGPGLLVGITRYNYEDPGPLYWDLEAEHVQVETWTRYYRSVAGVKSPDPEREDVRSVVDYGRASGSLVDHQPNADIGVVPNGPGGFNVSLSTSTSSFEPRDGYLYTSEGLMTSTLSAFIDPPPPDDPRWFHSAGEESNFEYIAADSRHWILMEDSFTVTFLYGTLEIHNETGTHQIEAKREHISGTPPLHEEFSITRAFVHITGASSYLEPGGRFLQVNLAGYDIPASSMVRLVNATGTWFFDEHATWFSDANVRVTGENLRLTAEPSWYDGTLVARGQVNGSVSGISINGEPVDLGPPATEVARVENPFLGFWAPLSALAAIAVVGFLAVGGYHYQLATWRRQSPYMTNQAQRNLDGCEFKQAFRYARRALRGNPKDMDAAAVLAIASLKTGQVEKAIIALEKTKRQHVPLVRLLLSVILREEGESKQAHKMVVDLLDKNPHLHGIIAQMDLIDYVNGRLVMDQREKSDY